MGRPLSGVVPQAGASPTDDAPAASSLADRVRAALAGPSPSPCEGAPDVLEVLPGGHSGLTYRCRAGNGWAVVKAAPEGQRAVGRHDILRQARVMRALEHSDVPVPRVLALDPAAPPWFAMQLVEGESLEPVLDDPEVVPALAAARMRRAAEVLPRLQAVDPRVLPDAGRPLTPGDELQRWSRTMGAVPVELVEGAGDLERRLAGAVPAGLPPTLVHGDFRLGNIICEGTEPRALIDWEIWSIGDPRVEVGWFLVFADGRNFPGVGRVVAGLPAESELIELATGGTGSWEAMPWFQALGRFKMAAIMGHNLRRHREGRHHDPDQERLPATIRALIGSGLDLLA